MSNVRPTPVPSLSRLFDNWWERAPGLSRYAPLVMTLVVPIVLRTMGYNWE